MKDVQQKHFFFFIEFHSLPSLGYTPKREQLHLYKLRQMYSQLARRAAGTIMKHSSQRVSIHVQYVPPCVYCQLSTVNVKDSVPAEAHHVHFPDQRGDSGPELLPREER